MKLGVVFPQIEIGVDPGAVRAHGQAVEQIGYHHILAYEHVVGANTASRPNWRGPYDIDSVFHEPFVLFGFLAGLTERIEFATGIVILPQRQTVLVAKQAAALDVLCGCGCGSASASASAGTPWSTRRSAPTSTTADAVSIDTMRLGLPDAESHIGLLERFHAATGAVAEP